MTNIGLIGVLPGRSQSMPDTACGNMSIAIFPKRRLCIAPTKMRWIDAFPHLVRMVFFSSLKNLRVYVEFVARP